jgi:hypothetical protein
VNAGFTTENNTSGVTLRRHEIYCDLETFPGGSQEYYQSSGVQVSAHREFYDPVYWTGAWHWFEIYFKASSTAGQVRMWIDGELLWDVGPRVTFGAAAGSNIYGPGYTPAIAAIPNMANDGIPAAQGGQDMYVDECLLTNDYTVANTFDVYGNRMIGPTYFAEAKFEGSGVSASTGTGTLSLQGAVPLAGVGSSLSTGTGTLFLYNDVALDGAGLSLSTGTGVLTKQGYALLAGSGESLSTGTGVLVVPLEATSISPTRVKLDGGYQLRVFGTFELGHTYHVHIGTTGTTADALCYSGVPGQGNTLIPWTSGILRAVTPELVFSETAYSVLVRDVTTNATKVLSNILTVSKKDFQAAVYALRKVQPPRLRTGPRRIEEEDPV